MKTREELQREWNVKGEQYARSINEMVAFGMSEGWENWKGEEATDDRGNIASAVLKLLREANKAGEVEAFREAFPPSQTAIVNLLDEKGGYIGDICPLGDDSAVFMRGTSFEERQAYLVKGNQVKVLDQEIRSVGKAMRGDVIAIEYEEKIVVRQGWEGSIICEFIADKLKEVNITRLIPFNDGQKVLVISSDGIYLLHSNEEQLLHPQPDEDGDTGIAMDHATLSYDNAYIVVGDQGSDHLILDEHGKQVGVVGPQSSYPHYCLFSKDDQQLLLNSCHFYNGISIGVDRDKLNGINIEGWEESDEYVVLNEEMRVYAGVSLEDYYILGDAYGYIRAIHKDGKELWQHFLGSTISGMGVSEDEKTLYVGTYAGTLHKLTLNREVRDTHTIGTASIYEDFRLLAWRNEDSVLVW